MTGTIKQGLRHCKAILLRALSKAKEIPWEDIAGSFGPDIALDTMKFLGEKITEAWQMRGKKKDVMTIIDSLSEEYKLTKEQEAILRKLPDHFGKDDDDIRKLLAGEQTIQEYCVEIMLTEGLKEKGLADKLAEAFDKELREILCITVNPSEIYRELQSNTELASEALEILRLQSQYLESSAQIELDFPIEFRPLHRVLEYHIMQHQIEKNMRNPASELPEPRFFRRPRTTWIDIAEGYVYYRQDVIEKIETGFKETNCQLVIGDSGSGKSTLSFILGYDRLTNLREGNEYDFQSVYYIDFVEHQGSQLTEAIRKILKIQNSIEIQNHKVLLIIDNIHVNLRLAKEVFQRFASSKITDKDTSATDIDFLFLSRPIAQKENQDSDGIQDIITGSETARDLLTTFTLENDEFSYAVKGIVTSYFKKQDIEISVQEIVEKLATKCSDSLWLVSFILESIDAKSYPIDIESIDICKLFNDYYFAIDSTSRIQGASSVFEIILRNWPEKDSEVHVRNIMGATLLALAIPGVWGIPISANFIVEILSVEGIQSDVSERFRMSDHDLLDRFNFLIGELQRLGEIVSSEDKITLPHATIADQMVRCAFSAGEEGTAATDDIQDLFQFQYLIDEEQLEMQFPYEKMTIALLKFQANRQNPIKHILTELLNEMGYHSTKFKSPTDLFIENIIGFTEELAEIFDDSYGFYNLIKLLQRSGHVGEKIPFVAEIIRKSNKPYLLIYSFSDFINLVDYEDIHIAIADSIRQKENVDKIIDSIKPYPQILESKDVQKALVEIIKRPPYPWIIINQITSIPTFLKSELIQRGLAEAMWKSPRSEPERIFSDLVIESNPEILDFITVHETFLEKIQNSKNVSDLAYFIGNWTDLMTHQEIQQEMKKKLMIIAESIDESSKPWDMLYLIGQWEPFQEDESIKSTIVGKIDYIADAIEQSKIPWDIIHKIGTWKQLQENDEIKKAIENQIPVIVTALRTSSKYSDIMRKIDDWPLLKQHPRIKRVYSKRRERTSLEAARSSRFGRGQYW